MTDFPYRASQSAAVDKLVATVREEPGCVAGCWIESTGQGFAMELEYLQRDDGTMRYRVWSDVQGIISTEERPALHDFAAALRELRGQSLDRRLRDPTGRARYATVALADRDGGVWVETPTPGRGEVPADDALGRIVALVFT